MQKYYKISKGFRTDLIGAQRHAELITDAMEKVPLLSACNGYLPYELIKALRVELPPDWAYAHRPCLQAAELTCLQAPCQHSAHLSVGERLEDSRSIWTWDRLAR